MEISLDYYSISLLIGGFTALLSGLVVYIHKRNHLENGAWFLLNISSATWSFGYFLMISAGSHDRALFWNWVLHGAAIFIPLCYFLCVLAITKTFNRNKGLFFGSLMTALFFFIVNPTEYFVRDVFQKGPFLFAPDAGPVYVYFTLYFFVLVLYSLVLVYRAYRSELEALAKQRFKYILLFTIAGFGGGGSVFFLTFNIPIPPYLILLFGIYPVISGYALFKYQLFDTKVVTTQILTFSLWIFIFIRTLLSSTPKEQLLNSVLLLVTVVLGILLIRSVLREIKTRERIEVLAKNLAKTNEDLAHANMRLKELDQLKSEFVSLATHQIRSPLSAIKGYVSLILEGDFGSVSDTLRDPLDKVFKSTQNLVMIVEDFLNISRIESGRMKYEFSKTNLSKVAEDVLYSLMPNINSSGLNFSSKIEPDIETSIDIGKMKQVFSNLIDNSLKYTKQGYIEISLKKEGQKAIFSVKDSGIGVSKETMSKLFQKFSRAKDANKTNISGTGLGLYVASEMVKAHNGRIWVDSEGEGMGSTFNVELPIG